MGLRFFEVLVINSFNTGTDHRMIRGRAKFDTTFERAKMVAQLKKVGTGKLQHYKREFEVEIQNRFAAFASIPSDDLDSRGDSTAKMIHKAAISIADRYKSEKPNKLSAGTKQALANEEGWHTNRQQRIFRDLQGDSTKDEGRHP